MYNTNVFVAMPFSEEFNDEFELAIQKAALEQHGFRCIRVDEEQFVGSVVGKITNEIDKAMLLIGELSVETPNAFL